jgi:glutaminyl-tRNA synthetase
VLRPLKVTITDWPEGRIEMIECQNHPEHPEMGSRQVPFGGALWIERDDFMENPPKEFFRLGPGREVRLRYAYNIRCDEVIRSPAGDVIELRCSHDPESRHGGRKVKGIIHWVSAAHSAAVPVRLYDRLFSVEEPRGDIDEINPRSLESLDGCQVEAAVAAMNAGERCQFERLGYFIADVKDSRPGTPVFNRTVTLKDTWAKLAAKLAGPRQ